MPNKVEVVVAVDGAQATKALKEVGATAIATGKANAEAAKAAALAAKYSGDAVTQESVRIVQSREKERQASIDAMRIQALTRKGFLDEATGVTAAAAAYQRLAAAKLETARASEVSAKTHDSVSLKERIGGVSLREAVPEGLEAITGIAAAGEIVDQLKEAVSRSLEFAEAMQRASRETGLEVGTLSTLHYAAAVTGGDFDRMAQAVARMDRMIAQATEGNKTSKAFMKSLGLNATDLANRTDGAEIAFRKFASTLAQTESPIRRVELASQLLGQRAGAEQIATLIELGDNWQIFQQKASAAGVELNGKLAEQLEATKERMADLQQHVEGAGLSFTAGLTPALTQVIAGVEALTGGVGSFNDLGARFGEEIKLDTQFLVAFVEALRESKDGLVWLDAEISHFFVSHGYTLTPQGYVSTSHSAAAAHQAKRAKDAIADIGKAQDDYARIVAAMNAPPTGILPGDHGKGNKGGKGGFGGVGDLTNTASREAEKQIKQFQDQLNHMILERNVDLKTEYDYWEQKKDTLVKGSAAYADEYSAIEAKQRTLAEEGLRQAHQRIARFMAEDVRRNGTVAPKDDALLTWRQHDARAQQDRYDVSNEIYAMQVRTGMALEEMRIRNEAGKSISQEAAALQLAAIHAQQYDAELQRLEAQKKAYTNNPLLSNGAEDQQKKIDALKKQIAELESRRTISIQQDAYAVKDADQSAVYGATRALEEFAQAATDASRVMQSWLNNSIDRTNGAIVNALTGPSWDRGRQFTSAGHEIFTSAAAGALKFGEGKFGIDGTSEARALWVRVAGHMNQYAVPKQLMNFSGGGDTGNVGMSSDLQSILSAMPAAAMPNVVQAGGGSGSSGAGIGSMVASAFSTLLKIPGFADGGDYPGNSLMLVGENGPEIMAPRSAGTIIPNHALGGDTYHHHWNIDARGATDPAQVHAAAQRAVMEAAPHIVRAIDERRMRRPSMRS
ncbi:hypothetical protein GCM10011507_34840 [Edaphobacter acidisoli]|uniref:Phage tail tape measure protein n=1 Tax=Edaphobacter acidisoli TaxID=2040573 RepID=A0A916WAN6_9BACT|nr:hypothetical protein [Edaphobacter acidisoli]GGA80658.1 hypothetical protein GCM10011507_34840 [Edaphobacter acidisoli]